MGRNVRFEFSALSAKEQGKTVILRSRRSAIRGAYEMELLRALSC